MTDREILYYLIHNFLNKKFNCNKFTQLFSNTYNLDTEYDELNPNEHENFRELASITDRFYPFKEYEESWGGYNEQQVREAAEEVWKNLEKERENLPEFPEPNKD